MQVVVDLSPKHRHGDETSFVMEQLEGLDVKVARFPHVNVNFGPAYQVMDLRWAYLLGTMTNLC